MATMLLDCVVGAGAPVECASPGAGSGAPAECMSPAKAEPDRTHARATANAKRFIFGFSLEVGDASHFATVTE